MSAPGTSRVLGVALPAVALLLLAAHFQRAGLYPLVAVSIALIGLSLVDDAWARRVLQVALFLGAAEWLRTAWVLAAHRAAMGLPYARMLAILCAVAAITLVAAVVARADSRDGSAAGSN
ncbi:MAG TPA: hypothetical protein PL152_03440 [Steroidobacteraceae bacterium]|nr:hypothetical protein [Steroidobacteraceae bacterium]